MYDCVHCQSATPIMRLCLLVNFTALLLDYYDFIWRTRCDVLFAKTRLNKQYVSVQFLSVHAFSIRSTVMFVEILKYYCDFQQEVWHQADEQREEHDVKSMRGNDKKKSTRGTANCVRKNETKGVCASIFLQKAILHFISNKSPNKSQCCIVKRIQ